MRVNPAQNAGFFIYLDSPKSAAICQCRFCTAAHTAAADLYLKDPAISAAAKTNPDAARQQGATDREIHDTVLITALFSLYNRYVDGLNTITPEEPAFYDRLGHILLEKGYLPSADRYSKL